MTYTQITKRLETNLDAAAFNSLCFGIMPRLLVGTYLVYGALFHDWRVSADVFFALLALAAALGGIVALSHYHTLRKGKIRQWIRKYETILDHVGREMFLAFTKNDLAQIQICRKHRRRILRRKLFLKKFLNKLDAP